VSFAAALGWVRRSSIWTSRAFAWTLIAAALSCAAVVLSLRYWFLPNIEQYREDIAAAVSRAANLRITIGTISADWDGMRPHLKLERVSVYDKAGRRALELERVESTLAWRSLAAFTLHFQALDIYRPSLEVRRDARGVMSVAGIELETKERKDGGFTEWLLQQPDVEVHDARVSWTDEMRQAPPLDLAGVSLHMVNRGRRHRFGLRALPPAHLAGPVDIRGDVRGDSAELVSNWNGKLFMQLDSPDLAAWGAWVDIPVELARGSGAVRSWLTFTDHQLADIVADVRLSDVRTRLREDLPELELDALAGRLAWRRIPSGFEFSTAKLALTGGGATLPAADFLLRMSADRSGTGHGELHANALELAPLVMLADRLPVNDDVRSQLVGYSPRGSVHDLVLKWQGELPAPQRYSVRGRFEALAVNQWEKMPGIAGLSGSVDGSEKGGTLHLNGQDASLDLPTVFGATLGLDTLTGQLAWTHAGDRVDVRLNNVSFANADAAGTVFGSYRSAPQGRGEIDLTGNLSRADGRAVPKYIPITELKKVRAWLERAVVAGESRDVRFRLKGRLEDFPFPQDARGVFHVAAKVTGGTLDYAEGWPRIENIEGDLQFRGSSLDFNARRGTVSGVTLGPVQGGIADMKAHPEVLELRGEAEGPTADFLAYIAKSPVSGMVDHFTDGMQAQGTGRLALKLTFPLGMPESTKVAGAYVFSNNNIVFEKDLPPLDQASGRIEFSENSVRVPGVSGTFLGGPLTLTAATAPRDATMRATMQGRINADNVRKVGGPAWMQQLRGATDWKGVLTLRKKIPDLVIESSLQGISSSLPAPFAKSASETVPLRIERRFISAQQDRLSFSYGDVAKAELARRNDGKQMVVERGTVRLGGGEAGEPDRPGVWIRGAVKTVDFDEWLGFSRGGGEGGGEPVYTIGGADLKIAQLDFFGRRFHDLGVSAWTQSGVTQITLAGSEVEGGAMWKDEGKGRLTARLKRLTLPVSDAKPAQTPKPPPAKAPELPALDVVVEQFQYGQKQLGRLELNAVNQDRDWRIERLRLSSADNVLTADGLWQGWQTQPRTQLNLKMEVTDIGRALARWALPAGVKGGTAKIEGQLSWAGSPVDFDYPTLAGQLGFDAAKGQFVKLEPGLAKLLGILSLQSLPRRISLDFRDVFSDGFAFDSIAGTTKIERGIAVTDNFRMAGPAARVAMSGEVDLVRETQKLRVRVTPHLSESVALAGALIGGPVIGAAAFLAQKILKDPIEQLATFEYSVTGNWSDPQVAKPERAALTTTTEGAP
jgi:uncharacterized protein (TIGR02099 family)